MRPDSGDAFVAGVDIIRCTSNQICQNHVMLTVCSQALQDAYGEMGFCPQFDVLWDLMTGEEHLRMFGRIKGLTGDNLDREVERFTREFDLVSHRHKRAGTYSGGTKRKLSVALALIGNPRVRRSAK